MFASSCIGQFLTPHDHFVLNIALHCQSHASYPMDLDSENARMRFENQWNILHGNVICGCLCKCPHSAVWLWSTWSSIAFCDECVRTLPIESTLVRRPGTGACIPLDYLFDYDESNENPSKNLLQLLHLSFPIAQHGSVRSIL